MKRFYKMIKILTGWGGPGGSTVAHINLVNALNAIGVESKLYSNQDWHSSKCSSGKLSELKVDKNDVLVVHFLNLPKQNCKKMIYSCHESDIDPLWKKDLSMYSKVHYVSRWQQQFHNTKKSYFILPNILEDLIKNPKPSIKIGGVVGSIDANKQTHKSIEDALNDGCEKVLLFGGVTDGNYFENYVKHLISDKVILMGVFNNKQEMYDMVTDVYQNSIRETWGFVAGECLITGTKYHNNGMCNFEFMKKDDILSRWIKECGLHV